MKTIFLISLTSSLRTLTSGGFIIGVSQVSHFPQNADPFWQWASFLSISSVKRLSPSDTQLKKTREVMEDTRDKLALVAAEKGGAVTLTGRTPPPTCIAPGAQHVVIASRHGNPDAQLGGRKGLVPLAHKWANRLLNHGTQCSMVVKRGGGELELF